MIRRSAQSGVTLVEVVIGIGIISVSLVAIGLSINTYVAARSALLNNLKATYLAEEGYEIIRAVRDTNWNTIDALSANGTYYFDVSGVAPVINTTPEIIDTDFRRSFVVREVYRNGSDDIVSSTTPGAVIDDGSRQFDIFVGGPNGTTTFQAILSNIYAI
jgi:type II secretory pathway pseudopilin PulG